MFFIPGLGAPVFLRGALAPVEPPVSAVGPPFYVSSGEVAQLALGQMTPGVPEDYDPNDLLLLFTVAHRQMGDVGPPSASGWTRGNIRAQAGDPFNGYIRQEVLWKTAVDGELLPVVSYPTTGDEDAGCAIVCAYRRANLVAPFENGVFADNMGISEIAPYALVDPTLRNRIILEIFAARQVTGTSGSPDAGWLERVDLSAEGLIPLTIQADEAPQGLPGNPPTGVHSFASSCVFSCRFAMAIKPASEDVDIKGSGALVARRAVVDGLYAPPVEAAGTLIAARSRVFGSQGFTGAGAMLTTDAVVTGVGGVIGVIGSGVLVAQSHTMSGTSVVPPTEYVTPGAFTIPVPSGMTKVTIEAIGAGGGSGGSGGSGGGQGGGGGAYSRKTNFSVIGIASLWIRVPVGGPENADTTSVHDATIRLNNSSGTIICLAKAGLGGLRDGGEGGGSYYNGGPASGGIGDLKFYGGQGANESFGNGGGGGSAAGPAGNGNDADQYSPPQGVGAPSPGYPAGKGGDNQPPPEGEGGLYGGGGGCDGGEARKGAQGYVKLTWSQ